MSCTIAQKVLPAGMDETAAADLKPIIKKMRELNDHRVRIVHGWWVIGGHMTFLQHVSRGQLKSSNYYTDSSEITALADMVLDLDGELRAWHRAHSKKKR